MATFVNTKIIINQSIKSKIFGYFIIVDSKNINYLTIKAVDYKGRGKGKVGRVNRNGSVEINAKHVAKLDPMLSKIDMRVKIDMTLDLIYGKSRIAIPKSAKSGLTSFNHSISQIMKPKNYSHLGGK